MTQPGADGESTNDKVVKALHVGWLRRLVSLEAIVLAAGALGVAVALFVAAGGVDVSADKPDGFIARNLLHFVFKRSEATRSAGVTPPADLYAASRVRLAAQHFDMVCANCHGRPGFGQSVTALSMNPRPQYLPKVLNQFSDKQLYMILEHGVKYSAMPSWATQDRGDEVWSMVAFLRQLQKTDGKWYRELTATAAKPATAPVGPDVAAALRPANAERNAPPVEEFAYAAPAAGFSDQVVHDNPAATCARCHGADGSGAATGGEAPNLTIQDPAYLRASLAAYVRGTRKSGYMQTVAAELSETQIAALSTYFAGLPVRTLPSPADPALVARGQTIATQGIRARAIPACANCHESAGSRINGAPHIAGQSATFLRRQLGAMSQGGRGSAVTWNPMPAVAHDLTGAEIAALAAYYSGLKPAKAGGGAAMTPMLAASSPKGGRESAQAIFGNRCVRCHLNGGRGDLEGAYPDLTIQHAGYVAQTLYTFRTRDRLNNKMQEVVDSLSFDDMTNLAAYVESLPPKSAFPAVSHDAAVRGAAIAERGDARRGVPACLGCHGAAGQAALPLIPALQGQSVAYLSRRLDGFTQRYRDNANALNPMPAIALRLTSQERSDLAAYFAAATPAPKATAQPTP